MAAVQQLPQRLREPVALFYIDGYTADEVAGLMELPAGTVRRRLHEARNRLRDYMEKTVGDQIRQSAPSPSFADDVLDRIADVRVFFRGTEDERNDAIVVTDEAGQSLQILIGRREAEALDQALARKPAPTQPSLYEVMAGVIREFGLRPRGIRITELKDHTFFAAIDLGTPTGDVCLDARPSDAINLAARLGVAMQVVRAVTRQVCPDEQALAKVIARTGSAASLDTLRKKVQASPADVGAKIELGSLLAKSQISAAYCLPRPLPPEQMAQRASERLAEARTLLIAAAEQATNAEQRRRAVLWLGTVEYLEGNSSEAVAAFERYDRSWHDLDWPMAFHFASALHQLSRNDEALARLADALAAIDRMHGAEPSAPDRLVARGTLAQLGRSSLAGVISEPRCRELFGPIDPPCLVVARRSGTPFKYGPAFVLGDRPATIGSAAEADIQLSDAKCAPLHARVATRKDGWTIEDLGSADGTWLGSKRVGDRERIRSYEFMRIGSTWLLFLNMAEYFGGEPADRPRAFFAHLDGPQAWFFRVPVAKHLRRERVRVRHRAAPPQARGAAAREIQPGSEAPAAPGFPSPWPVQRIAAAEEKDTLRLTVAGPADREVVLSGPGYRHEAIWQALSRSETLRPMTAHLTASLLAAGGLTCREIMIGPADEAGERRGRLRIASAERDAWFETHPIDALELALVLDVTPSVWVSDRR